MSINAFFEIDWYSGVLGLTNQIKAEIEAMDKEYVLNVNQDDLNKYFYEKYHFKPLTITPNSEHFDEPVKQLETYFDKRSGSMIKGDTYIFTIKYFFKGSPLLFQFKPNNCLVTTYEIEVFPNTNTVSFSFKLYSKDADEFNQIKTQCYRNAFINIDKINKDAVGWNNTLKNLIDNIFNPIKEKYLNENKFFETIKLKKSPESKSIFSVPTVKKKVIPQPEIPKSKKFVSEPSIALEIYYDILNVINNAGKKMETKPSLYIGKDEEGLRDQFLFILEDRYEGTTATGETFNKSGRTDILLKYAKDGSNLFIAECKFWKGIEEFYKAIDQLFDRYLTWRDSKVSLIVFVNNKDFTKVINTIKTDIKNHPYYLRENGKNGETSFSYIFHLPADKNKEIFLEVILFHFYNN